ncbi:hypothetical protein PM10SUCC1_29520 [Propionigenium maris DSM 9537]|uniref:Uncharacterized protein n=1 Tax=Propionigenium maris DSM 9537 TaxID=1123000 RepID=A0A9W6LP83_9FUSO|nr:hypothetical protein [Propionigenium maris]GLI57438.1 hypothetical protein PM10SUCC1_29520 [Propionigenium maris DSM 9537]
MKKGVNKSKPKGTKWDKDKKVKKSKRFEEDKMRRRRAENKRANAEARKERKAEQAIMEKVAGAKMVGFRRGMLLVEINGEVEKRALIHSKKLEKRILELKIGDIEIKLFGKNVKLQNIEGFEEMKEQLMWELEAIL